MKPLSFIALAALLVVFVAWNIQPKQRHINHSKLDISFYLDDNYSDTPVIDSSRYWSDGRINYYYPHKYDTTKSFDILFNCKVPWKLPTNQDAPFPTLDGIYEALLLKDPEHPRYDPDEKHYFFWKNSVQCLFYSASTPPRSSYYKGHRYNTLYTIPDSTTEIVMAYEDAGYTAATDSAAANRMIDSLVQSVRITLK
ncbi:MAG: hypothetical protein EOP51_01235 [Sphingobacteriales bacterium]|nr:MAG: hypothetical protein EOP51_01235 [Sphingobacteriales bacterium]